MVKFTLPAAVEWQLLGASTIIYLSIVTATYLGQVSS